MAKLFLIRGLAPSLQDQILRDKPFFKGNIFAIQAASLISCNNMLQSIGNQRITEMHDTFHSYMRHETNSREYFMLSNTGGHHQLLGDTYQFSK